MGLIFQSFALVPLMSAYENVEFGLRIAGVILICLRNDQRRHSIMLDSSHG